MFVMLRENSDKKSLGHAVRWANKALEFEGTNGLAHVVLAYANLMNRRHDKALALSYKAAELRPSCPTAIGSLANTLLHCGSPEEAIARTRMAMRLSPLYPPWLVNILAAAYRENGEIENSIVAATRAIEINPSDLEARLILCDAYYHTDRRQQAESLVGEILAIDPEFSVAWFAGRHPYKDRETLARLASSFRQLRLPK